MPARLLIIGLDGADPGLLARWCAEGHLPAIQALQSRGCSGMLSTPPGLGDDAAWPCFYTGESVGDHGRYFWKQLSPDGGRIELSCGRLPLSPAFWSRLSPDRRVAVIDLPKIPLRPSANTTQLCDWLVHGRDYPQALSHPADLAGRIIGEFGAAPPSLCDEVVPPLDKKEIAAVVERLCRSAAMKRGATCRYLAEGDWELMISVFKEAHCASHLLWHLVDPAHPDYRPGADASLDEPVKTVYQALDRAVGEIVEIAGPETSILLFTPLGMAVNITGEHLMAPLAEAINDRHRASLGLMARAAAASAWAIKPRGRFRRWREPFSLCRSLPHNEVSGALRLNVIGRDPGGMVAADGHQTLCRQLARELGELRDAETGRGIVERVLISQEVFAGRALDGLPDLFVVWKRYHPIGNAVSPQFGLIAAAPELHPRPGNHMEGGCYIVVGPARDRWQAKEVDISDLARLFLEAAGARMAA
ncbi:MAG TPA: alkaline phosphatase family protein [Dongiaceae bacterium]|jgi:predicted AlkP superfamily phosphohydrolase/phosphomutase|nr:alkaline phosphatase family protein [Dongiaceae bacterium]